MIRLLLAALCVAALAGSRVAALSDVERAEIESLQEEIARYEKALAGDVCSPGNRETMPAPVDPRAPMPERAPGSAQPQSKNLVDLLERATALVVAPLKEGASTGSGFFVDDHRVVTNGHVVRERKDAVFVFSRAGGASPARVVAQTPKSDVPGDPDFALLELERPATSAAALELNGSIEKLDGVVAAGFPGIVTEVDERFERLLGQGDTSAMPDLVLTRGEMNSRITTHGGHIALVHTAKIAPGNSGGPLVDGCGRIVGINTFMTRGPDVAANFALGAGEIAEFLQRSGVAAKEASIRCAND